MMDCSTQRVGTCWVEEVGDVPTGSWQRGYGRLEQKPQLEFGSIVATLSSVPRGTFLFGKGLHKMHAHKHVCAHHKHSCTYAQ